MHFNIYIAAYGMENRREVDTTFAGLVASLTVKPPIKYKLEYSLVTLGIPNDLKSEEIRDRTTAVMTTDRNNALRPVITYRDELHGHMRHDRQAYVFGIDPLDSESVRERIFRELVTVKEEGVLPRIVPRLVETYFGLTAIGYYYAERYRAEADLLISEINLQHKSLAVITGIEAIDGGKLVKA